MRIRVSVLAALASAAMLFNTGPALADVSDVFDSSHDIRHRPFNIPGDANGDGVVDPGETIPAPNLNQQICAYCHTPHYSDSAAGLPLWNRQAPVTTFTMYSSPTVKGTIDAAPNPYSLGCLSCHDGATAYDAVIKKPLDVDPPGSQPGTEIMKSSTMSLTRGRAVGANGDLSNDHPISVVYDVANGLNAVTANAGEFVERVGDMRLYDGKVECSSCHDVHDQNTYGHFLRATMDLSALCLQCHQ